MDISEVEGKEASADPNRESVSFRVHVVRAVCAGKAKLRVRVSGDGFCRWGLGWPDSLLLLLPRRGSGDLIVCKDSRIMDLCEATSPGH